VVSTLLNFQDRPPAYLGTSLNCQQHLIMKNVITSLEIFCNFPLDASLRVYKIPFWYKKNITDYQEHAYPRINHIKYEGFSYKYFCVMKVLKLEY
jgi:hypothetical protein